MRWLAGKRVFLCYISFVIQNYIRELIMGKKCIFCGKKPDNKTNEHIIPKWLIKSTGKSNRNAFLGKKDGKDIVFPYMKFVFPACKNCNNKYSDLEGSVKSAVDKIQEEKPITHSEFDKLLDWMDKIRIGLWIGRHQLHRSDYAHNFFINQRIGKKDRSLILYKIDDLEKGIGIIGTETNIFLNYPSCFGLIINNLMIFNISSDFLLGKGLGFPFPKEIGVDSNGNYGFDKLNMGLSKISSPIITGKIMLPAIKIYQAILSSPSLEIKKPTYGKRRKFFLNNSLLYKNGIVKSRIFVSNDFEDNSHKYWAKNSTKVFKFRRLFTRYQASVELAIMVLEHQSKLLTSDIDRMKEHEGKNMDYISFFEKELESHLSLIESYKEKRRNYEVKNV
jgi:hypothetical protein